MLTNCFRFAPRDSVPGLIAKICKYLKDHPGWSEEELEEQIKQFVSQTGVESFNGRTGAVELNENDVNNLKIASAYFAEGDETIDELDLVTLYNQGVRFVFTNWNIVTSGYDLAFVLDYFSGSNDVVYYPMANGSGGGGNIISVNGKTGIVELSLSDILGDSGAQVKLCTATEFTSTTSATWNAYYEDGYRIVGVVNSNATAIDYIYLLKQDENNHQPIGLSAGASDAYTPTNPPPYPVTSVNGKIGAVTGLYDAENPPPYPVKSVNGKTGAVTGLYDAENPPPYPVKSVNGKTGDVVGLYDIENPPPYPVTSVNGNTGIVQVNKLIVPGGFAELSDGGASRARLTLRGAGNNEGYGYSFYYEFDVDQPEIRVDDPVNGSRYLSIFTSRNPPPYPVTSVNGETGNVDGWNYFTAMPLANVSGSLPAGNTMSFFLNFEIEGQINGGIDGVIFKFDAYPLLWNVQPVSATKVNVLFHNPGGIPDNPALPLSGTWLRCFSTGEGRIKSVTYSKT